MAVSPSSEIASLPTSLDPLDLETTLLPGIFDSPASADFTSLSVSSPLFSGLNLPYGLDFDGSNYVVAEFGTNSFNARLRTISPDGSSNTSLAMSMVGRPRGVAVDGSNYIVTDSRNGRLFQVPISGGFRTLLASGLGLSLSVDVISSGRYVVTDANGRLLEVFADGTVNELITSGLGFPFGVTVEDATTYIVTDARGGRLLQIDAGSPATITPLITSGFLQPRGVTRQSAGVYLVADAGSAVDNGQVQVAVPNPDSTGSDPFVASSLGLHGNPNDVTLNGDAVAFTDLIDGTLNVETLVILQEAIPFLFNLNLIGIPVFAADVRIDVGQSNFAPETFDIPVSNTAAVADGLSTFTRVGVPPASAGVTSYLVASDPTTIGDGLGLLSGVTLFTLPGSSSLCVQIVELNAQTVIAESTACP